MTGLVIILTIVLAIVVVVQIGRLSELAASIRGEEEAAADSDKRNAYSSIVFVVVFLIGSVWSAIYYSDSLMGYGPHKSASTHGELLDSTFNLTLFITSIVTS